MSRIIYLVVLGVLGALALRAWVGEGIYIASGSMEPTLEVGTHLVLDKLTFQFRDPRRGDIIAFRGPEDEELVKRVIAVGGETVELRQKLVLIDGKPLDESYARHKRAGEALKGDNLGPLPVPRQHLFVLGDNRDESKDSASWLDADGQPQPFVPLGKVRGLIRGFY
ncbi:MAG: signal peptidase I [Elusimicrobia bacterium]|nr:signal peptidase I [Elusimicrobiota bacterium]